MKALCLYFHMMLFVSHNFGKWSFGNLVETCLWPHLAVKGLKDLGFINLLVAQSHPVMLLLCQLLINRDKVHQPNSESPAGAQSENRDCSKETGVASGMCFVNLVKSIEYLKHYMNSRTLTRHNEISLRASSPFGRAKRANRAVVRASEREAEERRACNDLS